MKEFYKKYFRHFNQLTIDYIFPYEQNYLDGNDWIDFQIWRNYHQNQWKIWEIYA